MVGAVLGVGLTLLVGGVIVGLFLWIMWMRERSKEQEATQTDYWGWACLDCVGHSHSIREYDRRTAEKYAKQHRSANKGHRPFVVLQSDLYESVYLNSTPYHERDDLVKEEIAADDVELVGDQPERGEDARVEAVVAGSRVDQPIPCPVEGCGFEKDWIPAYARHVKAHGLTYEEALELVEKGHTIPEPEPDDPEEDSPPVPEEKVGVVAEEPEENEPSYVERATACIEEVASQNEGMFTVGKVREVLRDRGMPTTSVKHAVLNAIQRDRSRFKSHGQGAWTLLPALEENEEGYYECPYDCMFYSDDKELMHGHIDASHIGVTSEP